MVRKSVVSATVLVASLGAVFIVLMMSASFAVLLLRSDSPLAWTHNPHFTGGSDEKPNEAPLLSASRSEQTMLRQHPARSSNDRATDEDGGDVVSNDYPPYLF